MTIKALSQWNKPKLQAQSCANCNAFLPNRQHNPKSGEARQGWCRAAPPGIVQVMVQGLQGPQAGLQGVWPPTNSDAWCRAFEEKDTPPEEVA